jgi:predicted RNA polymerase sigma factor
MARPRAVPLVARSGPASGPLGGDAVIALNRAVAIGEMRGAAAGLHALDSLDVTLLEDYQPYHAARADLLARALLWCSWLP